MNIGESVTFNYTGGIQTFTVPDEGIYKLEVFGGSGGASLIQGSKGYEGGAGGYSVGYKKFKPNEILYIVCGGKGADGVYRGTASGGYNGGGSGTWDGGDDEASGGGGGATHIAKVTGTLQSIGKTSFDTNGLIVAGGGGGRSWDCNVGAGGGLSGGTGGGTGGTQTSGYAFGRGQDASGTASSDGVGGGGAGYYGGYMLNSGGNSSGGGGSGWIAGCPTITCAGVTYTSSTTANVWTGNGKAVITLIAYDVHPYKSPEIGGEVNVNDINPYPGYTDLEYIGSTGSQWINTNSLTTVNTKYYIKMMFTAIMSDLYSYGTYTPCVGFCNYPGNSCILRFPGTDISFTSELGAITTNKIYEITHSSNEATINGVTKTSTDTASSSNKNFYLFRSNDLAQSYAGSQRVYAFKKWESNVLVRDMVPVKRDSDGVLGMYDKVENKFYTNNGSGTFTAGPVVTKNYTSVKAIPNQRYSFVDWNLLDYVPIEYIESTGTQWIDSGINVRNVYYNTFRIVTKVEALAENINFFGTGNHYFGGVVSGNTTYHYGPTGSSGGYADSGIALLGAPHIIDYNLYTTKFYIDGVQKGTLGHYKRGVDGNFMLPQNGSSYRIYYAFCYINDTQVRNFIPVCRVSDGEVGLYDLVTNMFYKNQGTGKFIGGGVK